MDTKIGEFTVPFVVLYCDERSKLVPIDQNGVIKRYSSSQIRSYVEQTSMLDDSIKERKIKYCNLETKTDRDEPEYDCENVQLNVG